MSFKEDVILPETVSWGSSFGAGFRSLIIGGASGVEEISQLIGGAGRRTYDARFGIKTVEQLIAVNRIMIVCNGSTFGFRFKDWLDYSTNQTGLTSLVTPTDEIIGVGDGTQTVFQLVKRYTIGTTTVVRNILKPIDGTVRVSLNDVEITTGFTVNTTNGEITSAVPPNAGVVIKAGCEFHTPVRFGEEVDKGLPIQIDNFDAGSIPSIPMIEKVDSRFAVDAYNYRGGKNHGNMNGADVSLTALQGIAHCFTPTATGLDINLPNEANLATGGPHFFLKNDGSQSLTIKNSGGSTVASLGVGKSGTVWLGVDDVGAKTWLVQIS